MALILFLQDEINVDEKEAVRPSVEETGLVLLAASRCDNEVIVF